MKRKGSAVAGTCGRIRECKKWWNMLTLHGFLHTVGGDYRNCQPSSLFGTGPPEYVPHLSFLGMILDIFAEMYPAVRDDLCAERSEEGGDKIFGWFVFGGWTPFLSPRGGRGRQLLPNENHF